MLTRVPVPCMYAVAPTARHPDAQPRPWLADSAGRGSRAPPAGGVPSYAREMKAATHMAKAIICILRTQLQVEEIITRLRAVELPISAISLVLLERSGVLGLVRDRDAHIHGSKAREILSGGPIGGVLGMLTQIGSVSVPGAHAHITAGPLAARMEAVAGRSGAVAESLATMGITVERAQEFERQVRQGAILLGATTTTERQLRDATAILTRHRAEDMLVSEEHAFTSIPV